MNAKMKKSAAAANAPVPSSPMPTQRGTPENITVTRKGGKIILTIDESVRLRTSTTGRSQIVASTNGWTKLDDKSGFSLTIYTKD